MYKYVDKNKKKIQIISKIIINIRTINLET